MTKKIKKRFVAGAVCPNCKEMDTLMLYFENNVEKIQCVSCDFSKSQTDKNVSAATRQKEDVIGVFKP
jgi:uncharacterized metal-binding protein (TIGR02443 family)